MYSYTNPTLVDLINFEPYFKAIAENDIIEIKNCLVEFVTKSGNLTSEKRMIYNLRYEIGLILACLSLSDDDVDIFEQIFLPASSFYKRLIGELNPLSILTQAKKFKLTNVLIGHYVGEISSANCSEHLVSIMLSHEEKNQGISEARLQAKLVVIMQTYQHIRRQQNLTMRDI